MLNSFQYLWQQLFNFIDSMIQALDNVLISGGLESLKTYQLDIKLLSETPIFSIDVYTVLIWLCLVFGFFLIYKFFKALITLPYNFLTK